MLYSVGRTPGSQPTSWSALLPKHRIRTIPQQHPDGSARYYVTQEMQPQQHPRNGDTAGAEEQSRRQLGIEMHHGQSDREGRNGVAGGERELVGRQQPGPTRRLDAAGPLAASNPLELQE